VAIARIQQTKKLIRIRTMLNLLESTLIGSASSATVAVALGGLVTITTFGLPILGVGALAGITLFLTSND